MSYLVTARKWRPHLFADLVGQSHVATTLRNAIATNRLSHAYIFSGPRGVGKTTTARILSKAINCLHPVDFNPDNTCDLCMEITEGRSVNVFEIDGASNRGVDEIRNLREAVRYGPAKGKYKVYIIDEVHMLTKEAFNALLKTLEEPPSYIIFIFATTEIHKVPPTILSRCQRFDFRRIAIEEIISRLRFIAREERIVIDEDALLLIARRADGSLRDAQSIFDQIVSFCGASVDAKQIIALLNIVDEEIFFRTTGIITARDANAGLMLVDELITSGIDLREYLRGLIEHFRNLLIVLITGSTRLAETSEHYKKQYSLDSKSFSENDLLRLIKIAVDADDAIRWGQSAGGGRFTLEVALMQMIKLDSSVQIDLLLRQLDEVKKKVSGASNGQSRLNVRPAPEPRTETPVRGSVKASQPALRPDQVVPPILDTPHTPHTIAGFNLHRAAGGATTISISDAREKWPVFVSEACKHAIAVGTMLGESALIDVRDNNLQIACPDDFHLDAIKRNRGFLSTLARNVYGAVVRLDPSVSSPQSASTQRIGSPAGSGPSQNHQASQHPVVAALVREFGARELE